MYMYMYMYMYTHTHSLTHSLTHTHTHTHTLKPYSVLTRILHAKDKNYNSKGYKRDFTIIQRVHCDYKGYCTLYKKHRENAETIPCCETENFQYNYISSISYVNILDIYIIHVV